jgi:TolA-binding protein
VPIEGVTVTKPDVRVAVSHLFAGRLPEAEQAYRELATAYPQNPTFQLATRMLSKRNSADCRALSDTKKSCPTVKP